ncbi:electron transfer flavoprotein subunit alpha/FixB family protein [Sedimentisphaera salicampi]|uniref:electron transfer flavoprotein subunit alpha/FixB family protein n=1 Tax=Sedimentisphaera salicampi TaxID=1941349 RepID=UPI000B9BE5F5|nr:electron transfer flavoprotein subunit alpha/FixB family protein [Sedimentisphaera salicampi]OXU15561.1 Electron transfer flavoprotein large subunit [Sedimentisphaera salicampi]
MLNIWCIAEHRKGKLGRISFELLQKAKQLAEKTDVNLTSVVIGCNLTNDVLKKLFSYGAHKVIYLEGKGLNDFSAEKYSECLAGIIKQRGPDIILAGSTTMGRTLMPYLAVKLETGLTADCTLLDYDGTNLIQIRPALSGNLMAVIKTPNHRPQMATLRPGIVSNLEKSTASDGELEKLDAAINLKNRINKIEHKEADGKFNITEAQTVVAVGKGIKSPKNLDLICDLAETIGAALGASRDVVDRGWLDYSRQIGLSGHIITPKLYIGIGVSGAIQHTAGMQDAKQIIAINKDPKARIFEFADFGLVGDFLEVVPALIKKLDCKNLVL